MARYHRILRLVVNGLVGLSLLFGSLPVTEANAAPAQNRSQPVEATAFASDQQPVESALAFGLEPIRAVSAPREVASEDASPRQDNRPSAATYTPLPLPVTLTLNWDAQTPSSDLAHRSSEVLNGTAPAEAVGLSPAAFQPGNDLYASMLKGVAYRHNNGEAQIDVYNPENLRGENDDAGTRFVYHYLKLGGYEYSYIDIDFGGLVTTGASGLVKVRYKDPSTAGYGVLFNFHPSQSAYISQDGTAWTKVAGDWGNVWTDGASAAFKWGSDVSVASTTFRYVRLGWLPPWGNPPIYADGAIDAVRISDVTDFVRDFGPLNSDQTLSKGECPLTACSIEAQHFAADPINTYSGNYNYQVTDLSIPAVGQPLRFERTYNSLPVSSTVVYSRPLGYGWTHTYDLHLTLPGDAGGEADTVILKAPHGSRLRFEEDGDGTYAAYPGVWADMVRQGASAPYTYVITAANQTVYTFGILSDSVAVEPVWTTPPAGLTLAPNYQVAAAPGTVFSVTHTLTNTGTATDTYTITVSSDGGWVTVEPVTATLAAGASTPVTATLTAPASYGRDASLTAALTATSWTTPTLAATAVETLTLRGYRLLSIRDPQGNQTGLSYNSSDYLGRVTDVASQRYLDFGYDGQGRLASVADHTGRSVGYAYDAYNNLAVVTDARGLAWTYAYTTAGGGAGTGHYLHQVIDPDGRVVERTFFDPQGRAYRQEDGLGNPLVQITYLADGRRAVSEAGVVITDTYNGLNLLAGQTDAEGNQQDFSFDRYFNRTGVTDANDNPTYYARTQDGYTTAITDALGYTTVFTYDQATNNLIAMQDARGVVTRYQYDGNKLITTTANYQDGSFNPNFPDEDVRTIYTYNGWGQVTSIRDPNGRVTSYGYDGLGQRTVITDALGHPTRFGYDSLGRVVTTTDALDKVTINTYDAGDHLIRVTENYLAGQPQNYTPPGPPFEGGIYNLVTQYAYDGAGRRTLMTDTLNRVTRQEYDAAGRLITTTVNYVDGVFSSSQTDKDLVTSYEYDTSGRLVRVVEQRGAETRRTRTEYDPATGRLKKSIVNYQDGTYEANDPDADIVTEYQYDANGNQTLVIDTLDRRTKTNYDALNRPVTVTVNYVDGVFNSLDPDEDVQTVYTYDAVGNQTQITNPSSQITHYDYDALNRVIRVTDALDGETAYTYDAAGNRTGVTDAENHTTSYGYDALNRVVTTTNHLNGQTVVTYDAVGNRTGVTDARNNQTVYKYDSLYRLVEVRQDYLDGVPEGGPQSGDLVTTFDYDAAGNRTGMTDAESNTTDYAYDDLNRVRLITNALDYTRVYTYDGWGDRVAAGDENGHVSHYIYDDLGRLTQAEDAEGNTTTYTYDGLGNRLSVTNGEGETTTYHYDDLNRLVEVRQDYLDGLPEGGPQSGDLVTTYTYDAPGNRVAMIDAEEVETRYEYDGLNRLVAVTENYQANQGGDHETNVRTEYGYDPAGNRTAITNALTYPTLYTYDELNRLVAVEDAEGNITRYGYDAAGNRTVITDAGQAVTHFVYDHANRLTSIDYPAGTPDVSFTYDQVGNRRTMADGTGSTTYDYDDLYRLESVTDGADQTVGYTYDNAGNRKTMTYPGDRVVSYSYDDANRLDQVEDWDGGMYDYTFDAAGRLAQIVLSNTLAGTGAITSTYQYDEAGRLVALTHASLTQTLASYTYQLDGVGNRRVVTETLVAPVDLGQAMHFLPEERPTLYADGEFMEPEWLGPMYTGLRPAYAGLRLPDMAVLDNEDDRATLPGQALGVSREPLGRGTDNTRAPGLAALEPVFAGLPLWQATVTPTITASLEPTPPAEAATPTPTETETPTAVPTDTETPTAAPTDTATPVVETVTATSSPAATDTPEPALTETPTATFTPIPTDTPTAAPSPTLTATPVTPPTLTPTVIVTPTLTPTPSVDIGQLSLSLAADPATVSPGQAFSVTLYLSNAGPSPVAEVVLMTFLPPALAYQDSVGEPAPVYDPRLPVLSWMIKSLAPGQTLEVGCQVQVAGEAAPGRLSLAAQAQVAGLEDILHASSTITVEQRVEPAPTPLPAPTRQPAGPPAFLSIVVEPPHLYPGQAATVLVFAADAQGRAIAGGEAVSLEVEGGELSAAQASPREGLVRLSLTAAPQAGPGPGQGRVVARLGEVTGEATFTVGEAAGGPAGDAAERLPFDAAAAIQRVRNRLRPVGAGQWAAENGRYRAAFDANGLELSLKEDDAGDRSALEAAGGARLSFRLVEVQAGGQVLYRSQARPGAPEAVENEARYRRAPGVVESYRALNHAVQQLFTLEAPLPYAGDLVIRGRLDTPLRPELLSSEEGLVFHLPGVAREGDRGVLRYSGALARDARGQEIYADLALQNGHLSLSLPAWWLAEAEYPVVIDPMIGDPGLVSDPREMQGELDLAYNAAADEYLAVWGGYDTGEASADLEGQRVRASDGALLGGLITIAQAVEDQTLPALAYHADAGEYLVLWTDYRDDDDGDVYGQRVAADGGLLGGNFAVAATEALQDRPDLAYNPVDDVYLAAWRDRRGESVHIYGQVISAGGVLSGTNLAIYTGTADNYSPRLAYNGPANQFLVVWARSNNDITAKRLSGTGVLLDNPGTPENEASPAVAFVISNASGNQDTPAVAADDVAGDYLVVWRDRRTDSYGDIYGQVVAADGALAGANFSIAASPAVYQTDPDLAYDGVNDRYLAVWRDRRSGSDDIYGQLVARDGGLSGNNLAVYAGSSTQSHPEAAANSDSGGYLAAWRDRRNESTNVYGRRVAGDGAIQGDAFPIGPVTGLKQYPWAAFNAATGEYLLVWEDYRAGDADIYAQRLSAAGQPLGSNLRISDVGAAGDQIEPRVAAGGDAGWLVAWRDKRNSNYGHIYGQIVAASGTLAGSNFVIAATSAGQIQPDLAFNSDDRLYLAVWRDDRNDIYGDIYAQFITPGGGLSGSNFVVSAYPVRTQSRPSLGYAHPAGGAGEFLVAWHHYQASGNYDIYGQRLSRQGALLDNPGTPEDESNPAVSFAISTAADYQTEPRVAVEATSGGYLAVWLDKRNYSSAGYDVYGQVITAGGALAGGNLALATASGDQKLPAVAPLAGAGDFLAVWSDVRDGVWDVYAQRVSASGATVGGNQELVENTGTLAGLAAAGRAGAPEVLLAWEHYNEIYAQRYGVIVAEFEAAPWHGSAPLSVTFTNLSTPTTEINAYAWDFGDGFTGTQTAPVHVYQQPGVYSVTLTASGPAGANSRVRPAYIVANTPFTPATDLRGYWRLEELSGGRQDASGWGNHLADYNGVGWLEAGQMGGAADFERDQAHYLAISHTLQNGLAITGSLTLMGWVRPESINQRMILAAKYQIYYGGAEDAGYRVGLMQDNRLQFIVSPDGTYQDAYDLRGNTPLATGSWQHVAAVFDAQAKELRLYLDGQPDGGQAVNFDHIHLSGAPFMLGADLNDQGQVDQYFDGGLDEWRVYARALSQAEIQTVMAFTPDQPIAGLSAANDSPTEAGQATTLTATVTAGSNVSYAWAFGDNQTGVGGVVTHTYPAAGNYTAVVTASNSVSVVTATTAVTITGTPALTLTKRGPAVAPAGELITYTLLVTNVGTASAHNLVITDAIPSGAHYAGGGTRVGDVVSWTMALLPNTAGTQFSFAVTATGTITNHNYRVSADGGVSAVGQKVVTTTILAAGFSATPLTGTVPLTVTFTNLSTPTQVITSAVWAYGDGVISNTLALTHAHVYTQAGVYSVTLSVSDSVVTDTLTRTNYLTVSAGIGYTTTRVITYTYDPLYRLTGADYSTGEAFAYSYDAVGNRLTLTRTLGLSQTVHSYQYDQANRLVNVDGQAYTWDDNGNLLDDGARSFAYDAANRLTVVTSGTLTTTFQYDGLGNRVAQSVDGTTTTYALDVAGRLPEVIVATTGGSSIYYVQIQGQILAQQDSGGWGYVLPDHLGSVRQLVDVGRQVGLAQSYDPFGNPFETSGSGVSDFGYTGEWWESDTQLLFLRARYYDPATGRFLSKDPWQGDDLQPQSLNSWNYVEGNPVRYRDPSGHWVCEDAVDCQRLQRLVKARVFYLNQIGNVGGNIFQPNPDPNDEQGYILYRVGQVVGPENVKHIPIYKGNVGITRFQMFAEMFECRIWSPIATNAIVKDIETNPLASGEKLIIIGNSGGGTVAIESLDLLEESGVFVDQVILRGSPVQELRLRNVGRVDYITSKFDYYRSVDINPFDDVAVEEHKVDFWWHVPPNAQVIKKIADLIVDLITR